MLNSAFGDTILTFDATDSSNYDLTESYGSNATVTTGQTNKRTPGYTVSGDGTPDISVKFAPVGNRDNANGNAPGDAGWQTHTGGAWAGGVAQLEAIQGASCTITFTPDNNDTAVILKDFNFIGDTNNDTYQYLIEVFEISDSGRISIYSFTTAEWVTDTTKPNSNAPTIDFGSLTGAYGSALEVVFTNLKGPRGNMAIDNFRFAQVIDTSPKRLEIAQGSSKTVASYTDTGFNDSLGVTNNGTLFVNLPGAPDPGSPNGLLIKDLRGSNSGALIDTSGSTTNSVVTLTDDGDPAHLNGAYAGSIKGKAQIVKGGNSSYNLIVGGNVEASKLTINTGKLEVDGNLGISGDVIVNGGTTLVTHGQNSQVNGTLQVDGNWTPGDNSGMTANAVILNSSVSLQNGSRLSGNTITLNNSTLSVNGNPSAVTAGALALNNGNVNLSNGAVMTAGSISGSGTTTLSQGTLNLNTASTLDSKIKGNGTLNVQSGNLALGTTGELDRGIMLNLAQPASFTVDSANDAKNIIAGINGEGTLIMKGGTLQIKGQGTDFRGQFSQQGTDPGTVDYSGPGTQTWTGAGADFVNITQSGSGKTVLSNTADITYGDVRLASGTMEINNNLNSSSLTLGNNTAFLMTPQGGAPISPVVHTGDLSFGANGQATIYFDTAAMTSGTAFFTATGAVTQPTGGTFLFDLQAVGKNWVDEQYTLTLVDGNAPFDANAYRFKFNNLLTVMGYALANVNYDSGIKLTLQKSTENFLLPYANSSNASEAARSLWNAKENTSTDGVITSIVTSLLTSNATPEEINASLASFAGSSTTALLGSTRDDLYQQVRSIRNRATQMGLTPGYAYSDIPYFNAWIQGNGGWNRVDESGDKAGYTLDTWGGTAGFDVNVSQALTIGTAFTANHNRLKTKSYDYATGDNEALYANIFARLQIRDWTQILVITGAWNDINLDRNVSITGMDTIRSQGDTNGKSFGAFYETTYDFKLNRDKTTVLQPLFNASLYRTTIDSYTEHGAGDASMHVSGLNATHGRAGIGARLLGVFGTNLLGRATYGEVRAQAIQDYGDKTDAAFLAPVGSLNSGMTVYGTKAGRTGAQIGAGIAIPIAFDGTFYVDLDAEFKSHASNFTGNVGYRYNF